ncbi:putative splicing factor 3B subunit 3 [Tilletiaria anomala UBC 951]|uniref:DNA damage-binding protein 1 n=1 Tax=Tilletiaria anomala (strain ATCC 24038 / CBS 436.72 / UBC 951) TaxID=1037660 RepID=A0A066VUS4_TILAU|nr:putative splicing factor 3B subunit 3 [Tilletiaria anomala UBC 951]KDN45467.1 putative splicing factor 3B subunit 3 [Tilletiaria anomala UBC 951]
MHLLSLSLSAASAVNGAVVGQFSGTRTQEIVLAKTTRLHLLRPDTQNGKFQTVCEQEIFGTIRSVAAFRLIGGSKDYLIVGSDSGRIVILELDLKTMLFKQVHCETFGRSGSRRIVPGQYLAVDPKGRAVLVGSVEKSKLVYILNRDAEANLTISSPLEAHRSQAIIHSIVGVDVGYENPLFAAIEVDYEDADRDPSGEAFENAEKLLTYYELDLGLNHVVRRWSTPVDPRANTLLQVPGGYNQNSERWEGPSGVLVCSEDYITYKHQGSEDHRVPIPRRHNPLEDESKRRGSIVVASVCHRMKNAFFFLLQNEDGDLFKVTIDHQDETITSLRIKYFDTVPVATSLCILRAGFLLIASEAGPSHLYSFQKLGDDDDIPEYASTDYPANGMTEVPAAPPTFVPRTLDNLYPTDELPALDPIVDAVVANPLQEDTPQFFLACGKGARSSFKMLRNGLDVNEAVSSDLPGIPSNVWSTRLKKDDEFDSYIVLSFVNGTLVLSIGEQIEEVSDSGFLTSEPTFAVQQLGANALLQVHPRGIRHIMSDKTVTEWATPEAPDGSLTMIVATTTNERQVVVALDSNELVYFELDMDGQLNEYQERKNVGSRVLTMSMASVPEGRQRTPYLAVGCEDQTVRMISLDPECTLEGISIQALTASPSSICIAEMLDVTINRSHPTLFVNIGLQNGLLLRTVLDSISGQLTDTRTRFLGSRPVKLVRVRVLGQPAVLALSSRSWLSYTYQDRMQFTPLIFDALDHAWSFNAELCPEGLIGIAGGTLRIFTIPQLGTRLKQQVVPLPFTPRRMVCHPANNGLFYVVSADHRVLSRWAIEQREAARGNPLKAKDRGVLDLPAREFGSVRAEAGQWGSSISVVDAVNSQLAFQLELEGNESATSVAVVAFASAPSEHYLVVGLAVDAYVVPRASRTAYLATYKIGSDGKSLQLVHKTEVEEIPTVLKPFHGRLLAGLGKVLRIYDLGKKKLLRKCENKHFPAGIVSMETQGLRIVVGDVQESILYATYKPAENRLLIFADDTTSRWTTAVRMLDYETVAGGDKFGNVWISRMDTSVSKSVDEDPTGMTIMHEKSYLQGAPHRTELVAHYHLGDIVTSLSKASLVPGAKDVLIYTCLGGTIGVMVPFISKEDVDTVTTLEMHMRQENLSLVGRDHVAFRGYYAPVKGIVDGDLCETFGLLPPARQAAIAEELDRTPAEINKKLDSLRTTSAF